ncbi:tRNA(Ile)-lysidine synthase [Catalinimonas alkaloidigena]|uniref:tRNA(Ile)-lysidine synthase n=1 Tax=Catalinimonas alkaloidigena TaxID=1075417 RepID=A0A1G8WL84_9BACT|nr:tRNA lysidine(34) synthetase TilS [Catalinimonas alkaloidigena]SDJ79122.1 tRNA(Ile)-lysidine synthase [Catalinimonas alkaloidigena]
MLERFQAYLQTELRLSSEDHLLVAISGGVDSVVLTHLLYRSAFSFSLAHVNFGLRGNESDADEQFVRQLARDYQLPCHVHHVATKHYAAQHGVSTQMAARTLRYAWFQELVAQGKGTCVATAHHHNDVIETVLLNLVRGTGLAGLKGIAPRREVFVRPLLPFTKAEILAYAQTEALPWREDASNQTNAYRRNFVRHQVIPLLQQLNPNLEETFRENVAKTIAAQHVLAHTIAQLKTQVWQDCGTYVRLDPSPLTQLPEPAYLLSELLKAQGFSFRQCRAIWENQHVGSQFQSARWQLTVDRAHYLLTPLPTSSELPSVQRITPETRELQFPTGILRCSNFPAAQFQPASSSQVACLDYDLLQFPLEIRPWQPGDRLQPFGVRGHKKVSDLLVEQKIPRPLKQQVLVVVSAGEVVWLVGMRLHHRYRITEQTRHAFRMEWCPHPVSG